MSVPKQKKLLSGIQTSGRQHVGNYLGAMKQFLDFQDSYDSYIMVADLHALTTIHDAKILRDNIMSLALDYLAIGLDPEKVVLFRQSDIPEHTELTWIFNCLVTVPHLERAHAFKDKVAKGKEANMGLFDYPVLMASDILLYDPDIVPVGKDQQQHVEMTRDIAEKFNRIFGETFKLPEAHIKEDVDVVPGTDGQKMSKSYGNTIPLFATDEEIKKAVMSIPTDSKDVDEPKNPEEDIVFQLHKLFSEHELDEIREGYEKGGLGHGDSKKKLITNLEACIAPLREKRKELAKRPDDVIAIFEEGGKKAHAQAQVKMEEVRDKVGLTLDK